MGQEEDPTYLFLGSQLPPDCVQAVGIERDGEEETGQGMRLR